MAQTAAKADQRLTKCAVCNGTGKVKSPGSDKPKRCLQCRGTGQASGGYQTKG